MNVPAYLEKTPNPFFLNGSLNPPKGMKVSKKENTLVIDFKQSLKELASLIFTSDMPYEFVELVFGKNTTNSINLVHHFTKNTNLNVSLSLAKNSNIRVIETFLSGKPIKSKFNRAFSLREGARLRLSTGVFMDGIHEFTEEINLIEPSAALDYDTLYLGNRQDRFLITQNIRHSAPNTSSNVLNLMVSNQESSLEFYVNGYIAKGMAGSNCKQQNRGVILNELGSVRVDPKLFIDEYDVEAGHGAAIGQINEDELFYLLSRGLTENEAKRLIISGYTEPFVLSLGEGALKDKIIQRISKKLKGVIS